MGKPFSASTPDPDNRASGWLLILFLFGLGIGVLLTLVILDEARAESIIWPTPEVHGTVRDLTQLPQLPGVQMDPTNLQHQEWAQPVWTPVYPDLPPIAVDISVEPITGVGHSPKARQIVQDIYNRWKAWEDEHQ